MEQPVRVLRKAGELLTVLGGRREMSAAELATEVDQPRTTVYRLLATLGELGYVEQGSRRGLYRLGLELFRLGGAVAARFDERQAAIPVMERLHKATGETVFLAVRRNWEAVCIERLDGERVQSLALRVGGSLPLNAGGVSRALLAFSPDRVWDEYFAQATLERFTDKSIASRDALIEDLRTVRRRGYAISDEDVTVGIAAVAAPVFDHRGAVCASISISGIRPLILGSARRELVRLAVEGGREISASLGSTDGEKPVAEAHP
jgi:DNA-binding IclR family transcriptional regulator